MADENAVVESLDEVPEEVREFYVEGDEGYMPDPNRVLGAFGDIKKALAQANKEARDRRHQLEKIPDDWQDRLSEWEELKEKEKERERKKAEERGEFDKLRQQLQEQHQEQLEAERKKLTALEQQLEQKIVDESLATAASEHDAHAHLLPDYAKRFVRVIERDGRKVPVVVDENGDRRLNNDGDDMSINELVSWMSEQDRYKPLFKPTGATGGGSTGGNGAGRPAKKVTEMSDREKMDFIDEHGSERYNELLRESFS